MKKTWSVNQVEIMPVEISDEEYNQLLDEMAEMVYRYFCQLSENQSKAPVTNTTPVVGRTGTDG